MAKPTDHEKALKHQLQWAMFTKTGARAVIQSAKEDRNVLAEKKCTKEDHLKRMDEIISVFQKDYEDLCDYCDELKEQMEKNRISLRVRHRSTVEMH